MHRKQKGLKLILFFLLPVLLIGCDHATKVLAKEHLKDRAPKTWYHDTFRLEYAENTGAFLNFGDHWPATMSLILMSILPLLFLIFFFLYGLKKLSRHTIIYLLPYILIFSGGLGNIADRILNNRHVTDFMNLGIGDLRTGIFNVADLYVTIGVLLLVIQMRKQSALENATVPSNAGGKE